MSGEAQGGLTIGALVAGYRGVRVIEGLDLGPLERGELTVLVGPNAAGKSTLLRALAGLVTATGSACLGPDELLAMPSRQRAQRVAFMPQTLPSGTDLSVFEGVVTALRVSPSGAASDASAAGDDAVAVLERIGIADLAMRRLDSLSGGQRQLASLAQALVREPGLLLLDEPTSALDLRSQMVVMQIVRSVAREGRVVVAVVHDLNLAIRWADRVVMFHRGAVEVSGPSDKAITPEVLQKVYGVESRVERCSEGTLQVIVDGISAVPASTAGGAR